MLLLLPLLPTARRRLPPPCNKLTRTRHPQPLRSRNRDHAPPQAPVRRHHGQVAVRRPQPQRPEPRQTRQCGATTGMSPPGGLSPNGRSRMTHPSYKGEAAPGTALQAARHDTLRTADTDHAPPNAPVRRNHERAADRRPQPRRRTQGAAPTQQVKNRPHATQEPTRSRSSHASV